MPEICRLIGGPQDGGQVTIGSDSLKLPDNVYTGTSPLGDGFVAWSRKPSDRFPAKYNKHGSEFRFSNYLTFKIH